MEEPVQFAVVTKKDESLEKGKEKTITKGKKAAFLNSMKSGLKMAKKYLEN